LRTEPRENLLSDQIAKTAAYREPDVNGLTIRDGPWERAKESDAMLNEAERIHRSGCNGSGRHAKCQRVRQPGWTSKNHKAARSTTFLEANGQPAHHQGQHTPPDRLPGQGKGDRSLAESIRPIHRHDCDAIEDVIRGCGEQRNGNRKKSMPRFGNEVRHHECGHNKRKLENKLSEIH